MRYASEILICCMAWMSVLGSCMAKDPLDPELLKKVTKDVESVLSTTLVDQLQGAQSNRSAVNVEQTVPRNPEPAQNIHDKKPEIQFDNQVHPYHYERSYHYEYPPKPGSNPSSPVGYSESFYEPRFRPKSQLPDSHDPSYYRAELYSPFGTSPHQNSHLNSKVQESSNTNGNGDVKQADNSGTSEVVNGPTPLPPNSFAHPDVLNPPPHTNSFPSVDLGSYRHGPFGRPPTHPLPDYLPHRDGRFPESFHHRPVESYQPLPPLDSFRDYHGKEFQGYNEPRSSSPDSSNYGSQPLPPPFLGSFFPPGYQSPFYNSYRPSEHFNSLFADNFTRSFPLRPSFAGGFYPHHSYLPPQPSPTPSPPAPSPESKPEDPVPPGGPSSQPIPTTNPDDPAPTAAASNSVYQLKLFFPARDDRNDKSQPSDSAGELTYITESFRF